MLHRNRRWNITTIETMEETANKLINYSWTLCTGIRCGTLTLVNDATSEDGAQEYAVIREGRQVESLTVSWMEEEDLLRALKSLDATGAMPARRGDDGASIEVCTSLTSVAAALGGIPAAIDFGPVTIHEHVEGPCRFCA